MDRNNASTQRKMLKVAQVPLTGLKFKCVHTFLNPSIKFILIRNPVLKKSLKCTCLFGISSHL